MATHFLSHRDILWQARHFLLTLCSCLYFVLLFQCRAKKRDTQLHRQPQPLLQLPPVFTPHTLQHLDTGTTPHSKLLKHKSHFWPYGNSEKLSNLLQTNTKITLFTTYSWLHKYWHPLNFSTFLWGFIWKTNTKCVESFCLPFFARCQNSHPGALFGCLGLSVVLLKILRPVVKLQEFEKAIYWKQQFNQNKLLITSSKVLRTQVKTHKKKKN